MKVFISWSGPESKQIAEALREWLPEMFEAVDPYMSAQDNGAGVRWSTVIAEQLEESSFGILCCTPSNLGAPWLNFEAGALSKTVATARVVPLLHDLSPGDVGSPFSEFMAVRDDEDGVWETVKAINNSLDTSRDEPALRRAFVRTWPELKVKLDAVAAPTATVTSPKREDRELLEEILELLRAQANDRASQSPSPARTQSVRTHEVLADVERLRAVSNTLAANHPGLTVSIDEEAETVRLIAPSHMEAQERNAVKFAMRKAVDEVGWELVTRRRIRPPGTDEVTPTG
ncbi:hypothetical protein ASG36_14580 [Geodermatophilus sp. Leaf369]|uniref:toll/interleukin-1 receptor domain-containing protein n=1 Tax=Geodermatophilus sp. Leaf369 TaxID=1736354 RepID=UPI000701C898|nr:toll/interleukin-1 receptor domain-containing protein [Geodermatophilus sp. Leaf369]KQS57814.1 hypothetical protein ASG36_14580 [Geodermatophilus sp. Leaf369]